MPKKQRTLTDMLGGRKRVKADDGIARAVDVAASSSASKSDSPSPMAALAHVEPGWRNQLQSETSKLYFKRLLTFLASQEKSGKIVLPPRRMVFSAFNICPFDQVRVVIIGQDPYHGIGQAHGLAFSVQHGIQIPPSLRNIFKEAHNDVGTALKPSHGCLEGWSKQGVLLLNTCLTVRKSEANSHKNRGWEDFTDSVIRSLNREREGLVFLLWGNPAQKKAATVCTKRHLVIKSSHPSPLGATKTASPFIGSRCFSRANTYLVQRGGEPIDWSV